MDLLIPNPGLFIWSFIIFLITFLLLRKFAWKPILGGLKEREDDINSALKMAEETRAEMAKLKANNELLIAEAKQERDKIIKETKEASDNLIKEAKIAATREGNKIMEDARNSMAQERAAIVDQMKKDVASLSLEIAEKVLRKELTNKSQQESLVNDLIADAKLN